MSDPVDDGEERHNRTGIAGFRARSADMLAGAAEFAPPPPDEGSALARARVCSSKDSPPLGSTLPPSRDGLALIAPGAGDLPLALAEQLLDRLGERLGSERTSVRMYEALLAKFDALATRDGAPPRAELELILREEFDHYRMLEETVAQLGGDPTALTPAADLAATMCKGMLEVLLDPRTRFAQCLEAVLFAELIDTEQWRVVVSLTEQLGEHVAAQRFRRALAAEREHVERLRGWLARAQGRRVQ